MKGLTSRRRIGYSTLLARLPRGGAARCSSSEAAAHAPVASYECSKWAIPEMELSLIESSLKNGCKHIITRSCTQFDATVAGLKSLAAGNADLHVSHILALGRESDEQRLERWRHEINSLHTSLTGAHPSIVQRIFFQPVQLNLDGLRSALRDAQSILSVPAANLSHTSLGLSLDTAQLANLSQDPSSLRSVAAALSTLYDENRLSSLAMAYNCMTLEAAHSLFSALRSEKSSPALQLLLTEQLRTHSVKPGLLWSQYDFFPAPTAVADASAAIRGLDRQEHSELQVAVHNYKLALDHCFQVEKQLLERWATESPGAAFPFDSLCLGHMLLSSSSPLNADTPEEFDLVVHLHVQPRYANQLAEVQARGKVWANWARLYRPMASYLLAAQRRVLQAQCLTGARKGLRLVVQNGGEEKGVDGSHLPYWIAALGSTAMQADSVGFQLCKVGWRLVKTCPSSFPAFWTNHLPW